MIVIQTNISNKLRIENICFTYDLTPVLSDISFSVAEKECIALLGASGCGKSTLLNIISGLYTAQSGNIYVDDEKIQGIYPIFSYMPQKDLLLPWMTILENVCLYGKLHKIDQKQEALEKLDLFGLKDCAFLYPHQLSGGMRQRAAFLRTALCHADILLLDEPFAALDIITREEMQDWLFTLKSTWNKTMLLVTHDIDEAIYLADRVLLLDGSSHRIVAEYEVKEKTKSRTWLFKQSHLKEKIYGGIQQCRL